MLLVIFMLAGVVVLGGTILHFLSTSASTAEPTDIWGKICILAFVVGWNILVVWMFRHNMRTLTQLKKDEVADRDRTPRSGEPSHPTGRTDHVSGESAVRGR